MHPLPKIKKTSLKEMDNSLVYLVKFGGDLLGGRATEVHDGKPEADIFMRVLLAQEAGELL